MFACSEDDANGILPTVSQENVERATRILNAIAPRDLDTLIELADPDIDWQSFFAMSEDGVYHGHAGLRDYVDDLHEAWEILNPTIDDALGIGAVVVMVGHIHYRGKGSGVESDSVAGWLFEFRDGKALRFRAFSDPERVLAAIGGRG
jgi:ketosteroid isomerase-like protein